MSKHTKGHWKIDQLSIKTNEINIYAKGTPLIAKVFLRDVSINEQIANANLIAAAPELLEALENIMGWIPAEPVECNGNKCRELYCVSCFGEDTAKETLEGLKVKVVIAKQAIAKAKGEAND